MRRKKSDWRSSVTPSSASVSLRSPPFALTLPKPSMTRSKVPVTSVCHAALNCSTDIPATSAHVCKVLPLVETDMPISFMVLLNAEPPACASRPRDAAAAATPKISAWDMPACVPADAIPCDMAEILLSVVAMLLPSATIELAYRPASPCAMRVMLANCANSVAAVSASISVAISSPATVMAKSWSLSLLQPSCAPSASMLRMVLALTGCVRESSTAPRLRFW